jgi:hypothetical protein
MKKVVILSLIALLSSLRVLGQCNPQPAPFHEDFQSVTAPMQWPACWTSTMGSLFSFTSSSGSFAGCTGGQSNYFNSPEFILNSGYTYSASVVLWQSVSNKLWDKVSLYLVKGSNQNLGVVASGTSFAMSDTTIGGTFSVVNTGTFHLGIQFTKASGTPPPLSIGFFDDVRIDCAGMIVSSPTMICAGENLEIAAYSALSYTFQNSGGSSNENPFVDQPTADETYTVSGLIYGNCVDTRIIQVKVDECLGVAENKMEVGLYPNPFHDRLVFQAKRPKGRIAIFDLFGNELCSQAITGLSTELVLNDLAPGMYVARFTDGVTQTAMKLICK